MHASTALSAAAMLQVQMLGDTPLPYGVRLVTENVFRGRRMRLLCEDDVPVCSCRERFASAPQLCSYAACENVAVRTECLDGFCSPSRCCNKRLQRRQWCPALRVVNAGTRGLGLASTALISAGTFLLEYCGEVLSAEEKDARLRSGTRHYYLMALARGEFLDAARVRTVAGFINHSCDPNACPELWSVGAETRVAISAVRDINAGEEVTFDYGWGAAQRLTVCGCGANMCRALMNVKHEKATAPDAMPLGWWCTPGAVQNGDAASALIGRWVRVWWDGDAGSAAAGLAAQVDHTSIETHVCAAATATSNQMGIDLAALGSDAVTAVIAAGVSLRKRRVMFLDPAGRGCWYTARVTSWCSTSLKHRVVYAADAESAEEDFMSVGASPWLLLESLTTRKSLNAFISRFREKMLDGEPTVEVLPLTTASENMRCVPLCDHSLQELISVPFIFPDDAHGDLVEGVEEIELSHFLHDSSPHVPDPSTFEISSLVVPRRVASNPDAGIFTFPTMAPPLGVPVSCVQFISRNDRQPALADHELLFSHAATAHEAQKSTGAQVAVEAQRKSTATDYTTALEQYAAQEAISRRQIRDGVLQQHNAEVVKLEAISQGQPIAHRRAIKQKLPRASDSFQAKHARLANDKGGASKRSPGLVKFSPPAMSLDPLELPLATIASISCYPFLNAVLQLRSFSSCIPNKEQLFCSLVDAVKLSCPPLLPHLTAEVLCLGATLAQAGGGIGNCVKDAVAEAICLVSKSHCSSYAVNDFSALNRSFVSTVAPCDASSTLCAPLALTLAAVDFIAAALSLNKWSDVDAPAALARTSALRLSVGAIVNFEQMSCFLTEAISSSVCSKSPPDHSLQSAVREAAAALCLSTTVSGLWARGHSNRAVASAVAYASAAVVLPRVNFVRDGSVIEGYSAALHSKRASGFFDPASRSYFCTDRWVEALRSCNAFSPHIEETAALLSEIISTNLEVIYKVDPQQVSAMKCQAGELFFGIAGSVIADTVLLSRISPFPLLQLSDLLSSCPTTDSNDLRLEHTNSLSVPVVGASLEPFSLMHVVRGDGCSSDVFIQLRRVLQREITGTLRLHAGIWADMGSLCHSLRKCPETVTARGTMTASTDHTASSALTLPEDCWFGATHMLSVLCPSHALKVPSLSASDQAVPRAPHFLCPLHLISCDVDSLALVYEPCPHSLSSLFLVNATPSLLPSHRQRLAYQLTRAVVRADDRGASLPGLCPSAVLIDGGGHVKVDAGRTGVSVIQERFVKKVGQLLTVPEKPGAAASDMKPRAPSKERCGELSRVLIESEAGNSSYGAMPAFACPSPREGHPILDAPLVDNPDARAEFLMALACVPPEALLGLPPCAVLPSSHSFSLGMCFSLAIFGTLPWLPHTQVEDAFHKMCVAYDARDPLMDAALSASFLPPAGMLRLRAGRVLSALSAIEAVVGPLGDMWPISAALPHAAWAHAALKALRTSCPSLPLPAPLSLTPLSTRITGTLLLGVNSSSLQKEAINSISRLIVIDPTRRCCARDVLAAPLFKICLDAEDAGGDSASAEACARLEEAGLLRRDGGSVFERLKPTLYR